VGEAFIRRAAAHDVAARVAYKGVPLAQAVAEVVRGSFVPGDGGFVGVDAAGAVVWDFNSPGMYRGCADSSGRLVTAIFPDEAAQQAGQQTAG
jgi:beta-aspartyl-peptidase (threonine type)